MYSGVQIGTQKEYGSQPVGEVIERRTFEADYFMTDHLDESVCCAHLNGVAPLSESDSFILTSAKNVATCSLT